MARTSKTIGQKISTAGSEAVDRVATAVGADNNQVPGPSPNPITNLMIHDVLLRAGGRLLRTTIEKGLLANRYGRHSATKMVDNRSVTQALAGYAVSRLATRSVPGAVLVGGSLLAKTLFDRSQSRRKATRKGDKSLRKTEAGE